MNRVVITGLGVSALGVPLVATVYDRSGDFIWLFAILGVLAAVVAATALFLPRERAAQAALPAAAE